MNKSERRVQSKTATFRIDEALLNALQHEADMKQISLNTLANQLFREYIEWYANAPKAGYVTLRKSLVNLMFDRLTDDEIIELAKETAKETRDIVTLMTSEYTLESALNVIEHKVRISGFTYRRQVSGDQYTYIIHHDMNRKWSLYYAGLFKAEFEQLGKTDSEFTVSDKSLIFKVRVD